MKQRGDTIIEVLFAVTVFCLVAVGGLSLMNQGTAMAQRALEIGLVRAEMDAQADALRYMHSAYVASFGQSDSAARTVWKQATSEHEIQPSQTQEFSAMSADDTCRLPAASPGASVGSDGAPYAIDIRKLDGGDKGSPIMTLSQTENIDATETFSRIRYYQDDQRKVALNPAVPQGIWIQAVRVQPQSNGILGYYDFHIRACWSTPGQKAPATLGTIVRLYDPRGVAEENL